MLFRQIIHEDRSCLSYMIGCSTKSTVAVIDPREDIEQYETIAKNNGLSIDVVIDTHSHADHLSGARELVKRNKAELLMSQNSPVAGVTKFVTDGEDIKVGNRTLKVIATPGHTKDSISLYVDDWYVLTADSLFVGDVGRVDLALEKLDDEQLDKNASDLYDSIQRLLELPDTTEVFPGHFAGSSCGKGMSAKMISTIGREKQKNEATKLERQDFIKYVREETTEPPEDYATIKETNIG